jgi:hypothetical protein
LAAFLLIGQAFGPPDLLYLVPEEKRAAYSSEFSHDIMPSLGSMRCGRLQIGPE